MAKQKCANLIVLPPQYEQYLKFSKLAREIYLRYTHLVEPFGMDECWLDVTGSEICGTGEEIAKEISETIQFELGLTVSIGISFNKIFAKLGSDLKKPNGITHIKKATFKQQIWHLPVNELLGVGNATYKKLSMRGIFTIGDLANTPEQLLHSWFGINGSKLKQYANGLDFSKVMANDYNLPIKSIGHGITTIQDLENSYEVWCVMLSLAQDLGSKLITHKKKAEGIAIDIRNKQLLTKQWQCPLSIPTQSALILAKNAFSLFNLQYSWECPIRSVTLRAISLTDENIPTQLNLFTDTSKLEKREKLDNTIEEIRKRFGKQAIQNATLLQNIKVSKAQNIQLFMPTGMVK